MIPFQKAWLKQLFQRRKETKTLRYVDFARTTGYDLSCVFKCEVPFLLVKDPTMSKSDNKSELEGTTAKKLDHPPTGVIPTKDMK